MRPGNDEGPTVAAATPQEQTKTDRADCAAKRAATLQAHAALHGFELRPVAGGQWVISRWGLVRELRDLDAAADLLRRMGVLR